MFKLIKQSLTNNITSVKRIEDNTYIPFNLSNTDYQNFKAQINADEAQLEDADGNVMSAEEAKQFISTLP